MSQAGSGVNLVEVADGIYQRETSQLIESVRFRESLDGVLFAASDAMGAAMGVEHLQQRGYNVLAVSGRITRSPLAVREAQRSTGLPVLGIAELGDPVAAAQLLGLTLPAFVDGRTEVGSFGPSMPADLRVPMQVDGSSVDTLSKPVSPDDFGEEVFVSSQEIVGTPIPPLS